MNKEELLKLFEKYKSYTYKTICIENFEKIIEEILRLYNLEKASLEAKVYTYEKIIANSNFKSILAKDKESMQKKIKELEQELEILKIKDWNLRNQRKDK